MFAACLWFCLLLGSRLLGLLALLFDFVLFVCVVFDYLFAFWLWVVCGLRLVCCLIVFGLWVFGYLCCLLFVVCIQLLVWLLVSLFRFGCWFLFGAYFWWLIALVFVYF